MLQVDIQDVGGDKMYIPAEMMAYDLNALEEIMFFSSSNNVNCRGCGCPGSVPNTGGNQCGACTGSLGSS